MTSEFVFATYGLEGAGFAFFASYVFHALLTYPIARHLTGFRWSIHMKPIVGTDLCMHAHVGFLARGEIHIEYADGCVVEHKAPQIVAIEPGHDGWVVGKEPVVMIEFDFEGDTVERLGMPEAHRHQE